jgi:ferrous iron transport protein B
MTPPSGLPTAAAPPLPETKSRRLRAALLGNPNTGKTTLFNALSGLNHRVGNYPGVTVESKVGQMTCAGLPFDLIDLPGTYSLAPRSPDEMVAVDVILGRQGGEVRPDVLVCIADASNLERNLYLASQALELGLPVIVALNMVDVAEGQGIHLDVPLLAERLGVPIVPIQANKRKGLDELRAIIAKMARSSAPVLMPLFPPAFVAEVESLSRLLDDVPTFLVRRLLIDVGGTTESRLLADRPELSEPLSEARERLEAAGFPVPAVEAKTRYAWIRKALVGCVQRPNVRPTTWTDRLDRVLTHRVGGAAVFLLVMFLLFQSIYTAAWPLMKLIDAGKDWLGGLVADALPPGPFTSLLVEGVIGGVGAVLVFLPQILILFAFIAVLEDCGYMARAAFLMDRLMSRCGLSGKSFIPLLSSLACAVPGIMATRVIEDRRDRLATIVTAPLMSCSARLPLYILLVAAFFTEGYPFWMPGMVMFGLYLVGLIAAPLVALLLKRSLLRGRTPVFVLEMPGYKWPGVTTVGRRVIDSAMMFLRRAGTTILASMILVWVLLNFPASDYPERIAALDEPVKELRDELRQEKESAKPDKPKVEALEEKLQPTDDAINAIQMKWKRQSYLGQFGRAIEPAVRPLGWDWRIGVAALASFPAREVVVSTLGIVFSQGKVDTEEIRNIGISGAAGTNLGKAIKAATWDDDPDRPLFTVASALSLLVFFALCCQCASTLAVIRRETRSWSWPAFTFAYMTVLAYVAAFVVFQVGSWMGG